MVIFFTNFCVVLVSAQPEQHKKKIMAMYCLQL